MTEAEESKTADFNGIYQKQGMQQEAGKEREENPEAFSQTDALSLNDSIRNGATVSGSTFGAESSTAKNSNIVVKNQARKGESKAMIASVPLMLCRQP
jgi:hypothetical protein